MVEAPDGRTRSAEHHRRAFGPHRAARVLLFLSLMGLPLCPASAVEQTVWVAGGYSFSDELGGFSIRAVTGSGTREHPIVIEEELYSASPVTLTIRTSAAGAPSDGNLENGALFLRFVIVNASGQSWVEFQFELQEILHQPSTFSDGLSFDQLRDETGAIGSDRFRHYSRDFEPYDQLRFTEGKLDAGESGAFDFPLTDFTPRWEFYVVQDPRIPYS